MAIATPIFECAHLKFTVSGQSKSTNKHTHTRAQCSHASVGLTQARPNKPSYLYRLSDSLMDTYLCRNSCLPLMLNTLARPYFYSFRKWKYTNKLPAIMSVHCRTWLPSKKPQNGTTLVAQISSLSALKG